MTRRELLAASLAVPALGARMPIDISRISAITDEIGDTPEDAIVFAREYNLQWVELRSVPGKKVGEYAFLDEPLIRQAAREISNNGLKVSFLNTSLMKFPWPGMEPARERRLREGQTLASVKENEAKRFERRFDDLHKALRAAHIFNVDRIRVFTGMRVKDPQSEMNRIADVIGEMAKIAEKEKVSLLVENEASCNVATSAELAQIMRMVSSRWVGINWDPDNETGLNAVPFPHGYNLLPKKRLGNVQIKAKSIMPGAPRMLDWKGIFQALQQDGYPYKIGLETHVFDGTLIQAAHASMKEILRLVQES